MPSDSTPGAADRHADDPTAPIRLTDGERAGPPGAQGLRAGGEPAFVVVAVQGDLSGTDWAHTVGLHRSTGHPELLVVGLPAHEAAAVVEELADRVVLGLRLVPGAAALLGDLRLRAVEVDRVAAERSGWFRVGAAILGVAEQDWPPTIQLVRNGATAIRTVAGGAGVRHRASRPGPESPRAA